MLVACSKWNKENDVYFQVTCFDMCPLRIINLRLDRHSAVGINNPSSLFSFPVPPNRLLSALIIPPVFVFGVCVCMCVVCARAFVLQFRR